MNSRDFKVDSGVDSAAFLGCEIGAGVILAAPSSGSGKTTLTLSLLRHYHNHGIAVAPAKTGPDFIDPAFHAIASHRPCYNLDPWAHRPESLLKIMGQMAKSADWFLVEGVMGLFDGNPKGAGSTASLATLTGWPVVLVVDVTGMCTSAAALVHGFATFDPGVKVAGVIFNRVGSPRHALLLEEACAPLDIPILGYLFRRKDRALPERHLGLVQAAEHPEMDRFLSHAAALAAQEVDCDSLQSLALSCFQGRETPVSAPPVNKIPAPTKPWEMIPPLGQHIAIASDVAYAFCYPSLLESWRQLGCELSFFSPLKDEAPHPRANAVYLPGGYPELHAAKLSNNGGFMAGLRRMAEEGKVIYGECGGYMTLGKTLVDKSGQSHAMAGLLPIETSFALPRRSLGYRQVSLRKDSVLGAVGQSFRAHEFHYSTVTGEDCSLSLFDAEDAAGQTLGPVGAVQGSVFGSYIHLLDRR